MTSEELREHEQKCWHEMPARLRLCAVEHLRERLPESFRELVRDGIARGGSDWPRQIGDDPMYVFHFAHGMWVRNLLREVVKDEETPTGNWDDCYIPALEEAVQS